MHEIRFADPAILLAEDGVRLTLRVAQADVWKARQFVLSAKKDKAFTAELKEFRTKRSLDANAYCWQLMDKLACAIGSTKEELYLRYVKECGPFKDFTMTEDEAKTFRVAWERLGTGWPTEQLDYAPDGERVVVRAYYGSSTYSVKRMSRLIDLVVEDCRNVGIETLTLDKIAMLKEDWDAQANKGNRNSAVS